MSASKLSPIISDSFAIEFESFNAWLKIKGFGFFTPILSESYTESKKISIPEFLSLLACTFLKPFVLRNNLYLFFKYNINSWDH